jgi:UDP-4-amino-4-deoxy-L-arabinose formyltransferase/UDP-glucuronic acid dehydrogenase (UDP-4-keto-hexauronic acid decarboxylating)
MKYNIVFFGVKSTSEIIVKYIYELGYKMDLLVTLEKKAAQKNHISGYADLSPVANELKIKCHFLNDYSLKDDIEKEFFLTNSFDIGLSYGWQRLIPSDILERFKYGIFGFHGSSMYLPSGRGRSPLNWSLIEGRKKIHNHLFQYEKEADKGKIFNIMDFEINPFNDILDLQCKSILTAKMQLKRLLASYKKGKIILKPQPKGKDSFYPKRTPEDGKINFNSTALEIYNLIRGVTRPFPGAFCFCGKDKVVIWEAFPFDSLLDFSGCKNGEVVDNIYHMPVIKAGKGAIILKNFESEHLLKRGDLLK